MKNADMLSLAIGAVVLYILYEWMQGAKQATGTLTNTIQSSSALPIPIVNLPPSAFAPFSASDACSQTGGVYNPQTLNCVGGMVEFAL